MFHRFPYTNMHELNLDWLIEEVKKAYSPDNPPENIVMSVNGMTGNVVLYEASIVRLPDVQDEQWNIYRMTAGNTARGIEFSGDGSAKIINGTTRDPIYTRDHPPIYPVQSVNGMTGNVQLFQEGNIQLPPIEAAQWNVYRFADEKAVGIKLEKDQAIYRINGSDRVKIYDAENPPPYPVTSVNGQTGAVVITFPVTSVNGQTGAVNIQVPFVNTSTEILDFQTDSPDDYWGMLRDTTNGEAGIYFTTENDTVKAYITYMPEDESSGQGQTFQLLTTNDIPESSGVVSINGKTGAVIIRATDIARTENNSETVEAALTRIDLKNNSQDTSISELQQAVTRIDQKDVTQDNNISGLQGDVSKIHQSIAIIADGDTHAAIQAGQAAFVKNHRTLATGLYWASAAIGTDAALTTSNLTADTNGGFNHLHGEIASLNSDFAWKALTPVTGNGNITLPAYDEAKEFIFVAHYGTPSALQPMSFFFSVPNISSIDGLTPTQGYYRANSTAFCQIYVNCRNHIANLSLLEISGVDYTATSKLDCYYR